MTDTPPEAAPDALPVEQRVAALESVVNDLMSDPRVARFVGRSTTASSSLVAQQVVAQQAATQIQTADLLTQVIAALNELPAAIAAAIRPGEATT